MRNTCTTKENELPIASMLQRLAQHQRRRSRFASLLNGVVPFRLIILGYGLVVRMLLKNHFSQIHEVQIVSTPEIVHANIPRAVLVLRVGGGP